MSIEWPLWWERHATLRYVLGGVILYCLVNAVITFAAGPNLALDDAKLNVLTQSLQWGYLPDNPPLYEWMLQAVQRVFGPGLVSVVVLKYGLFFLISLMIFNAVSLLTESRAMAAFSVLAQAGLYQIGFNYHQAFTHSLVLIAAVMFFMWMMARLVRDPSWVNYILLGTAIGAGVLAKYSFPATLVIVIAAIVADKDHRHCLLTPKILLSMLVAIIIILPHGVWALSHIGAYENPLTVRFGSDDPYLMRILTGIPSMVWLSVSFFLPGGAVLLILKPGLVRAFWMRRGEWIINTLGFGVMVLLGFVLALGVRSIPERYGIAFLLPGYVGIMVALWQTQISRQKTRWLLFSFFAIAMIIPAGRLLQTAMPGPPFCNGCRQWVPHDHLAKTVGDTIDAGTTLVGFDDLTAGNLRRNFPGHRVLSSHLPYYRPKTGSIGDACLFIWSTDLSPPPPAPLLDSFSEDAITTVTGKWTHPLKGPDWRKTTWVFVNISEDNYAYKTLCGLD